jgi:hypothetical protein
MSFFGVPVGERRVKEWGVVYYFDNTDPTNCRISIIGDHLNKPGKGIVSTDIVGYERNSAGEAFAYATTESGSRYALLDPPVENLKDVFIEALYVLSRMTGTDLLDAIKREEQGYGDIVLHRDDHGNLVKVVNNKHNLSIEWLGESAFIQKMKEMNEARERNEYN